MGKKSLTLKLTSGLKLRASFTVWPISMTLMTLPRYLTLVRASAWYDLLVTWPFALPWTFAWLYTQLVALALALQLPGTLHPLDATHMLLANLLGSVVVVWSLARLFGPTLRLGRLDGLARMLFASWQIYAFSQGASAVVLGFTAFELLFGLLQWWPVASAEAARRD